MTTASRYAGPRLVLAGLLLFGPAALVGVSALGETGVNRSVAVGTCVALAVEAAFLLARFGAQRAAGSLFVLAFYGVAAAVLRLNTADFLSAAVHLNLAVSLLIPVGLFVRRELSVTGGNARRVKFLIRELLARKEWPTSYDVYRTCPRIRALREGLAENAAPALPLLTHDDVRIQVAVLTALEFHPTWRKDQVEVILQRAQTSTEPAVRTAAVLALAEVTKPRHLTDLVAFLRDPSAEVRRAAGMAVLWDAGPRWSTIRAEVRQALAAPHAAKDGALPCSGALPAAALADLASWSGESGLIGRRATQTVVRHCQKAIHEDGSPEAIARVVNLVTDNQVPAGLRVELAHQLQKADVFPPDVASRLLGPQQPTMLRLAAAGAVLSQRSEPRAIEVLREAGRQPNREIALAAAVIVQKYLSFDMGLPVGGQMPVVNSREAADVTRRVSKWATEAAAQAAVETPADAIIHAEDAAYF